MTFGKDLLLACHQPSLFLDMVGEYLLLLFVAFCLGFLPCDLLGDYLLTARAILEFITDQLILSSPSWQKSRPLHTRSIALLLYG